MKITEFCLENRVTTLFLAAVAIVGGLPFLRVAARTATSKVSVIALRVHALKADCGQMPVVRKGNYSWQAA